MPIIVACPGCPAKLSAPDDAVGKQLRCPKCGTAAPVPALIPAEEMPVVDAAVVKPTKAEAKPKPRPVVAEVDDDDLPSKKSQAADDDDRDEDDEVRPRKKKRKRYADDDDDYEHDRPRPHLRRRRRSGGGAGGMTAVIIIGVLLLLGGIGTVVYFLVGKGSPFARKAPVPPGWRQYSYPNDGFKAYLPKEPTHVSFPVSQFPAIAAGFGGKQARVQVDDFLAEVEGAESISAYASGNWGDPVIIQIVIVHFRKEVPESIRKHMRTIAREGKIGENLRSVRWLGRDASERTQANDVFRMVLTDRDVITARVIGNGGRAKPQEEDGFFDNFQLTK